MGKERGIVRLLFLSESSPSFWIETKLVGVVHERPGNDQWETGVWIEAGTNGLKYNPITDELVICQHGNRAIAAMDHKGAIRRIASKGPQGKRFNSPNDLAVHKVHVSRAHLPVIIAGFIGIFVVRCVGECDGIFSQPEISILLIQCLEK